VVQLVNRTARILGKGINIILCLLKVLDEEIGTSGVVTMAELLGVWRA